MGSEGGNPASHGGKLSDIKLHDSGERVTTATREKLGGQSRFPPTIFSGSASNQKRYPSFNCRNQSATDPPPSRSNDTKPTLGSLLSSCLAISSSDGSPPAATSEARVNVQYDSLLLVAADMVGIDPSL